MQELGYNYFHRYSIGIYLITAKKNDNSVSRRNEIARKYINAFGDNIKFQSIKAGYLHAYHLFIIEVDNRKELYNFLKKYNILTQIHYIVCIFCRIIKRIGYDKLI